MNQVTVDNSSFALGFVLGQTCVYCEQVRTGAKLAAQLGCGGEHLAEVIEAIEHDACQYIVEARPHGRVAVWIYKHEYVRKLIESLDKEETPPSVSGVWTMGKLFGYADNEISMYLENHKDNL